MRATTIYKLSSNSLEYFGEVCYVDHKYAFQSSMLSIELFS